MRRKLLYAAVTILVLIMIGVFGKFQHVAEHRYKYAKATYQWGDVVGNLFETSTNNSQYLFGVGVRTKDYSEAKVYISDILFKGAKTGRIQTIKVSSKEGDLSNNYIAFHFQEVILPYENYIVSFKITIAADNKSIVEDIVLNFEKDYKEYYYSLWDTWMGI